MHIISLVSDSGIWICVGIVHKHLSFGVCIFVRFEFFREYLVVGQWHTMVNSTGIVIEGAIDGLDALDSFIAKDWQR